MEHSVYTNNDKVSQDIEQKMRETDKKYEQRIREDYVAAAWKRWFEAVKKNKTTTQQPPRQ